MWGHVINIGDFHFTLLSNKVVGIVERKVREVKRQMKANEVFAILITQTKRSKLAQQDIDL